MEELKLFLENLDHDGRFITHHTFSMDLNNGSFNDNKERILKDLQYGIDNFDMEQINQNKKCKEKFIMDIVDVLVAGSLGDVRNQPNKFVEAFEIGKKF